MASDDRRDSPGVLVPPPFIYLAGFALGWGLNELWPVGFVPDSMAAATDVVVDALVAAGVILAGAGIFSFARHRTALPPSMGASYLITTGVYRFSRNPIYVGLTSIYLGAALRTDIFWTMLLLPVVLVIMNGFVIRREEEHLTAVFEGDYRDYCRRVRRWI